MAHRTLKQNRTKKDYNSIRNKQANLNKSIRMRTRRNRGHLEELERLYIDGQDRIFLRFKEYTWPLGEGSSCVLKNTSLI